MKGSHKTQTCMPLKPVTIRDCGGVVQFFAEITGISIMQKVGEDRSWYVLPEEDIIRNGANRHRSCAPAMCVNIPVGVKHWHGAAPDSWFSHLAVEVPGDETSNEWLEAVDNTVYFKATGKEA